MPSQKDPLPDVRTKKLYRNAHLILKRVPRFSVADMNATMAARRGPCVAAMAAAVGVSADTIRHYEWTGLLLAPARTWPRRRPRLPDCGSSEAQHLCAAD